MILSVKITSVLLLIFITTCVEQTNILKTYLFLPREKIDCRFYIDTDGDTEIDDEVEQEFPNTISTLIDQPSKQSATFKRNEGLRLSTHLFYFDLLNKKRKVGEANLNKYVKT